MHVYAQDAEAYNQRNINEEGGGGYIAYVWDCAYWGTQVKLAQFTGSATYASEVPYLLISAMKDLVTALYRGCLVHLMQNDHHCM